MARRGFPGSEGEKKRRWTDDGEWKNKFTDEREGGHEEVYMLETGQTSPASTTGASHTAYLPERRQSRCSEARTSIISMG